jgi:Uma2 family endonuclease
VPTGRVGKLTYADFLKIPNDGRRHEIIDGVHYVTPSPAYRHQVLLGRLHLSLGQYLADRPLGDLVLGPYDILLSDYDVVEPDLLYVSRARRERITESKLQGSPDLVVEILSPSTRRRDLGIKRALYTRTGVLEYWIVDPKLDELTVCVRDGNVLGSRLLTKEDGDALKSALFPGWALPLPTLFE